MVCVGISFFLGVAIEVMKWIVWDVCDKTKVEKEYVVMVGLH